MLHSLRTLYITTLVIILMLIGLFAGSLVFFDKTSHKVYTYAFYREGRLSGIVKIDSFSTEDRAIFKSTTETPFDPVFTSSKMKIVYNRKYLLDSFSEERSTVDGFTWVTALENKDSQIAFLERSSASFIYVDAIPVRKDTFVFRDDAVLTYIPLIENYDFHKGRSQGFYAITCPAPGLPPVKRYVTLTSIRDEYLKIDGRRIKTENLLLKIRNAPQGSVWVAKSDRKVVMIELPKQGIRIVRSFKPRDLKAADMPHPAAAYVSEEVTFKNGPHQLAGTLTLPANGAPRHPAVLLVGGETPCSRDYAGLFSSIAGYLSGNGFATLRFDRRGTGRSFGASSWPARSETIDDIRSAVEFLSSRPDIDPEKIAVLTHGDGAIAASRAVQATGTVRALILMAPDIVTLTDYADKPDLLAEAAMRNGWDGEYQKTVLRASRLTAETITGARFGWVYLLGKRCALPGMRDELSRDTLADIAATKAPVLILQGSADRELVIESAPAIKRALEAAGNTAASLVYFDQLGHCFGQPAFDGVTKEHIIASDDVLGTIKAWLNKTMTAPQPALPAAPETKEAPQS